MKPPEPARPEAPPRLPPHAYVPGRTRRHAEDAFADLRGSVRPGMTPGELARTAAWRAGWLYLRRGYFWEAHEVLEPVWMQTPPNSVERHMVQAAIQLANAALKQRMRRPRAVRRLCDIADGHLQSCAGRREVMGRDPRDLAAFLAGLRESAGRAGRGK